MHNAHYLRKGLLMKIISLAFVPLVVFLGGCAPTKTIFINPQYENQAIQDASMGIDFPVNKLFIENTDDVVDDLGGGVADSVYHGWFESFFPAVLKKKSSLSTISFCQIPYDNKFEQTTFAMNEKESFTVQIPKPGTRFQDTSRFLLFIEGLKIYRVGPTSSAPMPGVTPSGTWPKLTNELKFLIWDNEYGRALSYGKAASESDCVFFTMTKRNWEDVVRKIISQLVSNTPLFKKVLD